MVSGILCGEKLPLFLLVLVVLFSAVAYVICYHLQLKY